MQLLSVQLATFLDDAAASRCNERVGLDARYLLQEIACASVLSVTEKQDGEMLYAVETFSRRSMSERAVIASIDDAVSDAQVVVSFGGRSFDLPVLAVRAMLHEVHVPRLLALQSGSETSRHLDLLEEVRRDSYFPSLAQLCAPFSITVGGEPLKKNAEPLSPGDWRLLEECCETNAVACWLAAQFWTEVHTPGRARVRWRDFARWAEAHAAEHPHLLSFATVSPRPGLSPGLTAFR